MAATILLVLVYDTGIAGAAVAALLSETIGFLLGVIVCRRYADGGFAVPLATLFDQAKLMRLLAVNSDIMLPTRLSYFRYPGSLTTPPCSEVVEWLLLATPIQVAAADVAAFAKLYPMNARPVQKDNRRYVLRSI